MAPKQTRPRVHPEFRHRSPIPVPAVEDVAQRLTDLRSPSWLAPRQRERRDPRQPPRRIRMRQRLLTLPVRVAIMVRLVWRRRPALATDPLYADMMSASKSVVTRMIWWVRKPGMPIR
jgi:hypothetical protein